MKYWSGLGAISLIGCIIVARLWDDAITRYDLLEAHADQATHQGVKPFVTDLGAQGFLGRQDRVAAEALIGADVSWEDEVRTPLGLGLVLQESTFETRDQGMEALFPPLLQCEEEDDISRCTWYTVTAGPP